MNKARSRLKTTFLTNLSPTPVKTEVISTPESTRPHHRHHSPKVPTLAWPAPGRLLWLAAALPGLFALRWLLTTYYPAQLQNLPLPLSFGPVLAAWAALVWPLSFALWRRPRWASWTTIVTTLGWWLKLTGWSPSWWWLGLAPILAVALELSWRLTHRPKSQSDQV